MADDISFDPSSLDTSSLDSWQPTNLNDPSGGGSTPWSDPSINAQALLGNNYSSFTMDPTGGGASAASLSGLAGLLGNRSLQGLLGLGSGLVGLNQGRNLQGLATTAFNQSNPFGPYRQQYAQQLGQLMQDPSSILKDPGYTFARDQGLQGVQRLMASQGYLGSGNEAIALDQYGMSFANQYLGQQEDRLAGLAGAGISPNFGPALSGYNAGVSQVGSGLASLGYGANVLTGGASAGTPGALNAYGVPLGLASAAGGGGQGFNSAGGQAAAAIGDTNAALGLYSGLTNLSGGTVSSGVSDAQGALGTASTALGVYSGVKKGGVAGYGMAAADAMQLVGDSSAGYVAAPLAAYNFAEGWKSGATGQDALSGMEAGAAIGSIIPGLGTVIGGVIGGVVGAASSALGSKDPTARAWRGWYTGGEQQDPSKISPTGLLDVMGGLWRAGDPGFGAIQDYGGKGGNANQFSAALGNQIASAIKSGKVSATTDYNTVFNQVVQPWLQGMGWNTNAAAGYGEYNLVKDLTYNYMNNRPIEWGEATGGLANFAYTPLSSFTGTGGNLGRTSLASTANAPWVGYMGPQAAQPASAPQQRMGIQPVMQRAA